MRNLTLARVLDYCRSADMTLATERVSATIYKIYRLIYAWLGAKRPSHAFQEEEMNRLPSIPAGKARVSFDTTTRGAKKVILDIPTWLQTVDNNGAPRTVTKFKRLQTSDYEMVNRFANALERGWFLEETNNKGDKVTVMDISTSRTLITLSKPKRVTGLTLAS